MIKQVIYG